MKLSRKAGCFIQNLRPQKWFLAGLTRFGLIQCVVGNYESIAIANISFREGFKGTFAQATKEALALIERTDKRHFHTVQREIYYIVNMELTSSAAYSCAVRQCQIDFAGCFVNTNGENVLERTHPHYEWHLAWYASVIVHEATHGRIDSWGISYTKKTRERIERICVTEQQRFAKRLNSEHYQFESMIDPFNAADWASSWKMSRWGEARELISRIQEAKRFPAS